MNTKKIVLWEIKKERLEKTIYLREKKIKVYRMETREDFRKFIVNSIWVITSFVKLLLSLIKLSVWYLTVLSLKIDKYLYLKK